MKGIGGPLLCIGDLLSDVGDGDRGGHHLAVDLDSPPSSSSSSPKPSSSLANSDLILQSSDLPKLFQGNYDRLNKALAGTDHSWTALTLKLCTALETANKLVQSTNTNAGLLLEKVGELETVVKRGDSTIAAARAIHDSLYQREGSLTGQKAKPQGSDHV